MFHHCVHSSLYITRAFVKLAQQAVQCQHKQLFLLPSNYKAMLFSANISTCGVLRGQSEEPPKDGIRVNYITKDGEKIVVYGKEGDNLMYLAQQNSIDIEGACEASLACCTCHVYVRDDYYKKLSSATEEEEDMLDMAPFLKSNSRLSCQLILSKEIEDIELTLPPATRNFYVDGKKPSHH